MVKVTKSEFHKMKLIEQRVYLKKISPDVILKPNNKGRYTKKIIKETIQCLLDPDSLFKIPSKSKSYLMRREADSLYYMCKDYINLYDKMFNPSFTDDDFNMKLKIFGIDSPKQCFVSGIKSGVGVGDHIFEVRGYHNPTGMYGSNSQWNLVPVTQSKNSGYKKFKFHDGTTKDIGYQTLTEYEYNQCNDEQKTIYNKLNKWKEYVKSRDAKICFKFSDELEQRIYNTVSKMYYTAHKDQQEIFDDINSGKLSL